jgi:glycosyltransferase involved in cell wall biosynthesis
VTPEPRPPGSSEGRVPGMRVVIDVRALQDPHHAPTTALYLDGLLGGFDAEPLAGESFVLLLRSDLDDPTERYPRLSFAGRRLLPPTHLLRSGALAVDPFLLGGASLGSGWRAGKTGAAGAVYHAVGGAVPLFSRLPTVVTLLDLAPWELPEAYQRGPTARFGQRLRAQLLREADAVIVGTTAVADTAHRLLHIRRDRLRVVPFAPRPGLGEPGDARAERERLGLAERYFVYSGRYDARQDLRTLLRALAELSRAGRPQDLAEDVSWPPRVLLLGTSPNDRAALARAATREEVGDALVYAPALDASRLARLVAGARAAILPAVSEAAGLAALDAIAAGVPVVASNVGALPEVVGPAGILVEPREPARLAAALATIWADDRVHGRLRLLAREAAAISARSWTDVARDTRAIYAKAGTGPTGRGRPPA